MAGHTCSVKPVEFPSDGKHIVSSEDKSIDTLNSVTERLITTTQVNFTDQSVIDDDGWICGNKGELLMWIPHLHRPSCYDHAQEGVGLLLLSSVSLFSVPLPKTFQNVP